MSGVPHLLLMSRKGCCLCEDAEAAAALLVAEGLCRLDVVDVDSDLQLAARFGADVPVLLLDGEEKMKHYVTADALKALLPVRSEV